MKIGMINIFQSIKDKSGFYVSYHITCRTQFLYNLINMSFPGQRTLNGQTKKFNVISDE
jgi:hypothetical protein